MTTRKSFRIILNTERKTYKMKKPKILLVDDEKEIRTMLHKFLGDNLKAEIKEAPNGTEALEIIAKEAIDLVLLDIKMPGISGVDVAKRIKENHPLVDIIMVSAWDSQTVADQALKEGAVDYITKPSPISLIYAKVSEVLKKKGFKDALGSE